MDEVIGGAIQTALVGTGYAVRVAARCYRSHPAYTLAAVVGRDRRRTLAKLRSADLPDGLAATISEVAQCDRLGLVHVASPNAHHERQVRRLLEHPGALLLEKPLSLDDDRQHELAAALSCREAPSFINFPLRTLGLPVPEAATPDPTTARVRLTSPFALRYLDVDTWKTADAQGGGIRHILMPHLCDYALQLMCRSGFEFDSIELVLEFSSDDPSEQLEVCLGDGERKVAMLSTADRERSGSDLFAALFGRSLDRLAAEIGNGHERNRPRAPSVLPLAGVEDLIAAYRLNALLDKRPTRREPGVLMWLLDRDDIREVFTSVVPDDRPSARHI